MKRCVVAGLALMGLMGCLTTPEAPAPTLPVFRAMSAPIASQTDVTAARMAGEWVIRQTFSGPTGPRALRFMLSDKGDLFFSEVSGFCDNDICAETETLYLMEPVGPGRWKTQSPSGTLPDEDLWVMWMDFDSRTAAIGNPSGEFGWIMDKNPTGGGDRITAARDIMEWFGYDLSRLEEVNL